MNPADATAGLSPPPDPSPDRAQKPVPQNIADVLTLLHILLAYGRHLAATLEHRAAVRGFSVIAQFFGTARVPAILARLSRGILRVMALERVLLARAARGRDLVFLERRTYAAREPQPALPQPPASAAAPPRDGRTPRSRQPANPGAARGGNPPPPDRPDDRRHLPRPRHLAQPVRENFLDRTVRNHHLVSRQPAEAHPGFPPPRGRLRAGVGPRSQPRPAGEKRRRHPPHVGVFHRGASGHAVLGARSARPGGRHRLALTAPAPPSYAERPGPERGRPRRSDSCRLPVDRAPRSIRAAILNRNYLLEGFDLTGEAELGD